MIHHGFDNPLYEENPKVTMKLVLMFLRNSIFLPESTSSMLERCSQERISSGLWRRSRCLEETRISKVSVWGSGVDEWTDTPRARTPHISRSYYNDRSRVFRGANGALQTCETLCLSVSVRGFGLPILDICFWAYR